MQLNTVIFDMDGLLIDSEPLWQEAADEVFRLYGVTLSQEQYQTTTGLRTTEFVQWWFRHFNIGEEELSRAERKIMHAVMDKVYKRGKIMPGVEYIFDFFEKRGFKIGLASSSPDKLIQLVLDLCGIRKYVQATSSAEFLTLGKPHPQVYLNCAEELKSSPTECICFEDSFNGMIAAKAARMKCVIVPHHSQLKDERWGAADLKLSSLQNFGSLHLNLLL
ncbi:hexitol phosphatase HxpB [Foetidibacter luteolus]|uniref:hexitol phosphatase HxpB n=1 Tax=Foetidibacter luteolus TaxID=2608880 RepID=UPI00129AD149|nr:hexitol phosphatase HxpB [Foetidibacter luteolus]